MNTAPASPEAITNTAPPPGPAEAGGERGVYQGASIALCLQHAVAGALGLLQLGDRRGEFGQGCLLITLALVIGGDDFAQLHVDLAADPQRDQGADDHRFRAEAVIGLAAKPGKGRPGDRAQNAEQPDLGDRPVQHPRGIEAAEGEDAIAWNWSSVFLSWNDV